MGEVPGIPRVYELVALERADGAAQEARRRAETGAGEGTLVWVRQETESRGRFGRAWLSGPGNLHCALVLRPDYPFGAALQLDYVAAVALGTTLAELVPPMVSLHYRWPNDVLLSGHKAAGIWLHAPPARNGQLEWMVLSLAVNVATSPQSGDFWSTSLRAVDEGGAADEIRVLEDFSRNFLSWINRWGEDGFAPVRRAWLQRAEDKDRAFAVQLPAETVSGTFEDVDEEGLLVLRRVGGDERRISIADFFALGGT